MTVLTAVMILGVISIVALLVIRLQPSTDIALPGEITLPDGTTPTAFTQGADWYAVVTQDNRILIYDRQTNTLKQEILVAE